MRTLPPLLPLGTIGGGMLLQRVWPLAGMPSGPVRYVAGGVILAIALMGLGRAVLLFRRSGQDPRPHTPTPSIIEQGPYRYTRNPMYLLMVVMCLGFGVMLANPWILALTPLCALLLQRLAILPEEAYLEQKFGDEYLQYKRRVRRWL